MDPELDDDIIIYIILLQLCTLADPSFYAMLLQLYRLRYPEHF